MDTLENELVIETKIAEDIEKPPEQLHNPSQLRDYLYDLRVRARLLRKKTSYYLRNKFYKYFTTILYITDSEVPLDYIHAFRKQYPDKNFKVLKPILKLTRGLIKTPITFDFYLQNKQHTAVLYKFKKTRDNVETYGLYSSSWEGQNLEDLQYLALYTKAMRICVKQLNSKLVHCCSKIPFFLGAEFESKLHYPAKVLQIIDDFSIYEMKQNEAFWALINIVDKKGMKKICRDKLIQKCIASLFNLHNTKRFTQLRECLEFIYKNYSKFRQQINVQDNIEENILFRRLNTRVVQLFPQVDIQDDKFYNPMKFTLKKVDFWALTSETYYDSVFKTPELAGGISDYLEKTKLKSDFVKVCADIPETILYKNFTQDNFRECRGINKKYLLKEFSVDRIKTNFVDRALFSSEDYVIKGYLDSFYEAPLMFGTYSPEIFQEGVDIVFTTILKLFEEHKNIQVIINIPKGLENPYIKAWVEFLEENSSFAGRWIFIDAELNLGKFMASSDVILLPRRVNTVSEIHYIALKYGCIPITSNCGMLNDTIVDIFDDISCGCGFKSSISFFTKDDVNDVYLNLVKKALGVYTQNPASWNLLIKNAMNQNFTWDFESIAKYNFIYNNL